ncbi:unnamed protein product [Moneuplotes crassus]|uniref:Cyclic nucleotide-binding domain-containing protein n=1 Tax=Euplotes crassus TaxID=5936 RepID=A0AAD1XI71_EUPCR|nr:unnamed protein product [Moneuplotes crassus]
MTKIKLKKKNITNQETESSSLKKLSSKCINSLSSTDFADLASDIDLLKFHEITQVLRMPLNTRRGQDIDKVADYLKNFKFQMKEINECINLLSKKDSSESGNTLKVLAQDMQLEVLNNDEIVFDYGDVENSNFYIILRGYVGVKVPTEVKLEPMNDMEFYSYLLKNKDQIVLEKSEIDPNFIETLKENKNESKLGIKKSKTLMLKKDSFKNSKEKVERKVCIMKEVSTLSDGDSFGELALLSNKSRAATIYCKQDPNRSGFARNKHYFAILGRKDFQKTLGRAQKKQLQLKTDFLQNFKIFSHFTLQTLQKLSYYMEERHFILNQTICKQAEEAKGVFLIKEGEFEMTKHNPLKKNNSIQSKISSSSSHVVRMSDVSKLKEIRICIISKHQIFGHLECIEDLPMNITVKAIKNNCSAYFISKEEFRERFNTKHAKELLLRQKNLSSIDSIDSRIQTREGLINKAHCSSMNLIIQDQLNYEDEGDIIKKLQIKNAIEKDDPFFQEEVVRTRWAMKKKLLNTSPKRGIKKSDNFDISKPPLGSISNKDQLERKLRFTIMNEGPNLELTSKTNVLSHKNEINYILEKKDETIRALDRKISKYLSKKYKTHHSGLTRPLSRIKFLKKSKMSVLPKPTTKSPQKKAKSQSLNKSLLKKFRNEKIHSSSRKDFLLNVSGIGCDTEKTAKKSLLPVLKPKVRQKKVVKVMKFKQKSKKSQYQRYDSGLKSMHPITEPDIKISRSFQKVFHVRALSEDKRSFEL